MSRRELRIARAGAEELSVLLSAALGPVRLDGSRRIEGILEDVTAERRADAALERLVADIGDAATAAEIAAARGRLPELVQNLLESGAGLASVNRRLTRVSNATTGRLVQLAANELGSPPAGFALLALGSEGREEQTPGSDQDNAIVYADGANGDPDAIREWSLHLGRRVCGWLEETGVPPCVGGMMASNPRWCAPISEWQGMFGRWIDEPEPLELLHFQIFFDFRPVHGDRGLAAGLRRSIAEHLRGEPPFFLHLARDALQRRLPPLFEGGILRDLLHAGSPLLDTKDALIPFVSFARLYALRHGVEATNTLARLDGLRERGVLKPGFHADITGAFTFLARVRLARQAASLQAGKKPDDILDVRKLDREGTAMLRHAASQAVLIREADQLRLPGLGSLTDGLLPHDRCRRDVLRTSPQPGPNTRAFPGPCPPRGSGATFPESVVQSACVFRQAQQCQAAEDPRDAEIVVVPDADPPGRFHRELRIRRDRHVGSHLESIEVQHHLEGLQELLPEAGILAEGDDLVRPDDGAAWNGRRFRRQGEQPLDVVVLGLQDLPLPSPHVFDGEAEGMHERLAAVEVEYFPHCVPRSVPR